MATGIFAPQALPRSIDPTTVRFDNIELPALGSFLVTAGKAVGVTLAVLVMLAVLFVIAVAPPVGLLALMLVLPAVVPFLLFGLVFYATQEMENERKLKK